MKNRLKLISLISFVILITLIGLRLLTDKNKQKGQDNTTDSALIMKAVDKWNSHEFILVRNGDNLTNEVNNLLRESNISGLSETQTKSLNLAINTFIQAMSAESYENYITAVSECYKIEKTTSTLKKTWHDVRAQNATSLTSISFSASTAFLYLINYSTIGDQSRYSGKIAMHASNAGSICYRSIIWGEFEKTKPVSDTACLVTLLYKTNQTTESRTSTRPISIEFLYLKNLDIWAPNFISLNTNAYDGFIVVY